jgi:hypothetical protein
MGARRSYCRRLPSRVYFQSRSIARLDHRIDDLRDAMNKSFDDFHDLLKSQVKRFEDRLERLEHPIVRQS